MREERERWAFSRGTKPGEGERGEPGSRRVEGIFWTVGCLQQIGVGESCIFNLHCAPFDTSSDLVRVRCGLRRRNITLGIHYD